MRRAEHYERDLTNLFFGIGVSAATAGMAIPAAGLAVRAADTLLAALLGLVDIQAGGSYNSDDNNCNDNICHNLLLGGQRSFLLQLVVGLADQQRNDNDKHDNSDEATDKAVAQSAGSDFFSIPILRRPFQCFF